MSHDVQNLPRPDPRDALLRDVCLADVALDAALPSRMAARVRRRRHLRQAGAACALLVVAVLAVFRASRPTAETRSAPALATVFPAEPVAAVATRPVEPATDAELLAHLENERVIIFTLADGQRQVVWLDGRPTS